MARQWLLDEDQALYQKLQGFSVYSRRGAQPSAPVNVWFRFPDPEQKAQRTFPHFAIDLIDIQFDRSRAHRSGHAILPYTPAVAPGAALNVQPASDTQTQVLEDLPLPWSLVYDISAYSREPLHDRQMSGFMFGQFPEQFGYLDMDSIDGSVRRADLVGVATRDRVDETQKRLFQKVFTVAVSSELALSTVQNISLVLQQPQFVINAYTQGVTDFSLQVPNVTETV